ncbi:MAG: hypothetical protein QF797_05550 [Alphaproteobacteria bacterium]|jgi:hypothetical protein|nr:hypothetical protein [Alphaproteobacteria bacterium]
MLDFNYSASFAEQVSALIDTALVTENAARPSRQYLGGSRLGVACERALQFEYAQAPKDDGRDFDGRTLRIFAAGHLFEEMAIGWLRQAGFDLYTTKGNRPDGEQFGFSVAGGRIRGHVDGIIAGGPEGLLPGVPALWECKSMNAKSWRDTAKRGVALSKPVYAAQIAVYQAYMEATVPGISANPALFTAINKDTSELHHELVPFDGGLAQRMSDKGVRIIQATEADDLLPRIASKPDFHECRFCSWADRCWRIEA